MPGRKSKFSAMQATLRACAPLWRPRPRAHHGQRLRDYYERLLAKVGAYPDVRAASLANITPLSGSQWNGDVTIQGYQWKPDEKPYIDFNSVSPHFFETLGIPIIAGRDFHAALRTSGSDM